MGQPQREAAEAAPSLDPAALLAQLEALQAENARLKIVAETARKSLKMKPSRAGALSLYGLGTRPVTLYPSQWETVLGMADEIRLGIEVGNRLEVFAKSKLHKVNRDDADLELVQAAFEQEFAKASAAL